MVKRVCREAVSFGSANAKFAGGPLSDGWPIGRPPDPEACRVPLCCARVISCPASLGGPSGFTEPVYEEKPVPTGCVCRAFTGAPRSRSHFTAERFVTSSCETQGARQGKSRVAGSGPVGLR